MPTPHNTTTYRGRIELLDKNDQVEEVLRDLGSNVDLVEECKFTLYRQGGCGPAQLTLSKPFTDSALEIGKSIRIYYNYVNSSTVPWYWGRIERVEANSPGGQTVHCTGWVVRLDEVRLGGLNSLDIRYPHLFARSNWYFDDPDRPDQDWEQISQYSQFMEIIYEDYIAPQGIGLDTISFPQDTDLYSLVFRGEETINDVLRTVAVASYGASWGVDSQRRFYFIPRSETLLDTFQDAQTVSELSRFEDASLIVNTLRIVGDMVYTKLPLPGGGVEATPSHWRYLDRFFDGPSRDTYGERSREFYLPFLRNRKDTEAWALNFLQQYAEPRTRYRITSFGVSSLLRPWDGYVRLLDKDGNTLVTDQFDEIEVDFTTAPILTITTGPESIQYPEPPERERWELQGGQKDPGPSLSLDLSGSFLFTSDGEGLSSGAPSSGEEGSDAPSSGTPSSGDSAGGSSDGGLGSLSLPPKDSSAFRSSDELGSQPSSAAPSSGEEVTSFEFPPKTSSGMESSDAPSSGEGSDAGSHAPSSDAPSSNYAPSLDDSSDFPSSDEEESGLTSEASASADSGSANESDCGCVKVLKDVTITASCSNGDVVIEVTKEYDYVSGCCV